ncbi:hypothetical protein [Planococcus sp. YIM B11945]|uniref:hypothetical protein n=1 Tax=Planococcus sp. YIM B11945 TaxID=3435410 RepID=UPI003D7C7A9B
MGQVIGTFFVAVVFVVIKSFFEKEKNGKMISLQSVFAVALLTVLFLIADILFL